MSDNKYQRGKIYRIVCNTTGLQYYGSTIEKYLCKRLSKHKYEFKQYFNNERSHFYTSFKILENDNYEIVLVENYPCASKDELHQRERFYIERNECVNKCVPLRTKHEYYNDNKEQIKENVKNYRESHVNEIKEYQKKWRQDNKEKMKEYFKDRHNR